MNKINKTEQEWEQELTPEQFQVLRKKATEAPFTGKYVDNHNAGMYKCAGCNTELFSSDTKFDSGSGWPSFTNPVNLEHIELSNDDSFGMERSEVLCKACGSHLGHVFNDGPVAEGGNRFCINSCALDFEEKTDE